MSSSYLNKCVYYKIVLFEDIWSQHDQYSAISDQWFSVALERWCTNWSRNQNLDLSLRTALTLNLRAHMPCSVDTTCHLSYALYFIWVIAAANQKQTPLHRVCCEEGSEAFRRAHVTCPSLCTTLLKSSFCYASFKHVGFSWSPLEPLLWMSSPTWEMSFKLFTASPSPCFGLGFVLVVLTCFVLCVCVWAVVHNSTPTPSRPTEQHTQPLPATAFKVKLHWYHFLVCPLQQAVWY